MSVAASALFVAIAPLTHTVALRNLALFVAFLGAIALWWREGKPGLPLWRPLAVWGGLAGLSLLWSIDPQLTRSALWTQLLRPVIVFWVFHLLASLGGSLRPWLWACWVSLATLSLGGFAASLGHPVWQEDAFIPALADYTGTVVIALPLTFGLVFHPGWRRRIPSGLVVLILLLPVALALGGWMAASRAFWVVPAAMVALGFFLRSSFLARPSATAIVLASVLVAAFISGELLSNEFGGTRPPFAFNERAILYRESFAHMLERPWLGSGFGHEINRHWHETYSTFKWIPHSHNLLLGYGGQLGFPGIAVILWVFGSLGRSFWRHLRHPDEYVRWIALLGTVLVGGVFLLNMPNVYLVRHNAMLFFAHAGLLLGLLHRAIADSGTEQARDGA